jgi:hypothetical protein
MEGKYMYKGTITTSTAVTANQDIPFNTILNTNTNTDPSENGVIKIRKSGFYNTQASVVISGYTASTEISLQLFANGKAIDESIVSTVAGATNTNPLTLTTAIIPVNVQPYNANIADISVKLSGPATITSGVFTIEQLK